MLVLSRKLYEKIKIGGNISITVVAIEHDRVKLGIDAPRDVPVFRTELLETDDDDEVDADDKKELARFFKQPLPPGDVCPNSDSAPVA